MSTGTIPSHVRMANDIAVQFHSRRDVDRVVVEIAEHMRTFWEPRMKTALLAYVDSDGTDLDELAARAAEHLRP